MLPQILQLGDPRLLEKSESYLPHETDLIASHFELLRTTLEQLMREYEFQSSLGLSLVQLGILKRGCAVWTPKEGCLFLANPRILESSSDTDEKFEGCLSFFDKRGLVRRPVAVTIEYEDQNFESKKLHAKGNLARIIQHEIDHLNGILYTSRLAQGRELIDSAFYQAIKAHSIAQNMAKDTLTWLLDFIRPGVSEIEIFEHVKKLLIQQGCSTFWYYDLPAIVQVGENTRHSFSGKDYKPTGRKVELNDIVTIDLNPVFDSCWGDYARTIFIENGRAMLAPQKNPTFKQAYEALTQLHEFFVKSANSEMSIEEIVDKLHQELSAKKINHLDFRSNFGHSIEKSLDKRIFLEKGNANRLGEFKFFTFEPHITFEDSKWAFKHENIYFFYNGKLQSI